MGDYSTEGKREERRETMKKKTIETWYSIVEISTDGLVQRPMKNDYGDSISRFPSWYSTMEEVDAAILEHGDEWDAYVILTKKRIVDSE